MKSTIILLLLYSVIKITAQPVLQENFDYTAGAFNTVQSQWISSGGTEAMVVDNNLSYDGYLLSSVGKLLNVSSSQTSDYDITLSISFESGKMYLSFLINVLDQTGLSGNTSAGDYFLHLKAGASNVVQLYIRKGAGDNDFQLGIKKKSGSTTSFLPTTLQVNQTHLVIICYSFNNGNTTDDEIFVWLNPAVTAFEPTPDLTFTDSQTDATSINKVSIRQGTSTPNAYIDGICVAASWAEVPLPVELISLSANYQGNSIILKWQTASEINNSGWEIERASTPLGTTSNGTSGNTIPSGVGEWEKIGFVKGKNIASGGLYSFQDKAFNSTLVSYRLKQIDFDGMFKYSSEVSVKMPLNEFTLYQNYPNPFNPVTKIKWMQPTSGKIRIDLYNIIGSHLGSLLDEEKDAGLHEINFHSGDLASGVYLVVFQFSDIKITRKIQLIK